VSHPGLEIDPNAAAAEFAGVAQVLGLPVHEVGSGADPVTLAAFAFAEIAATSDLTSSAAAAADQTAAAGAGARTVTGYETTEAGNEKALAPAAIHV